MKRDFSRPGNPVDITFVGAFNGSCDASALSQHGGSILEVATILEMEARLQYRLTPQQLRPSRTLKHHKGG